MSEKRIPYILAAVLLIAVLVTLPNAFNPTWALSGADADHTLTYNSGRLHWDSIEDIGKDGVLQLSMFKSDYDSVNAHNDEKIVAPGTGENTRIRIVNNAADAIRYTAVLYRVDDSSIPITTDLSGAATARSYSLPKGVTADQVEDVVSGTMSGRSVDMLDLTWQWHYSVDELADRHDAGLGTQSEGEKVEYGLYITVTDSSDGSEYVPKTGDDTSMKPWYALMALALAALAFFLIRGGRSEKAR